jgi:hypothetical protein
MNEIVADAALIAAAVSIAAACFAVGWRIGYWMRERHWARVAREEAESAASYKGADGHE